MTHDLRPPLYMRIRPVLQVLTDVAIAVVLSLIVMMATAMPTSPAEESPPLAILTGVAMGMPLVLRRRWPSTVLAVAVGASMVVLALGWLLPNAGIVPDGILAFAIYPVAVTASARRAVAALFLSVGGISAAVIFAVPRQPEPNWSESLTMLGTQMIIPIAVWVVGRAIHARRDYESRAVQQVLTDERLRIARDLHDGVAHSLSLITVQASVAGHVADEQPEQTRSALSVIETTSREAARELRRMLGLLRVVDDDSPETARLDPAPTADRLAELADHATSAGVRVNLRVGDGIDAVPSTVGLAVYRIVQESLTNVVKHAAPTRCVVRVDNTDHAVEIEVTDDGGRAPADHPPGHGLVGMRERVALYAGEFTAGPLPGHGFRVYARLPLEAVST
ncbi:sensor histidine kinase [Actinophytocola sediminis]